MKTLTLFFALFLLSFTSDHSCGDGKVYANRKQTQYDNRFDNYPKIDGVPKFKGGEKKLDQFVQNNIVLSDVAKTQVYNLNYKFTVTCEGKIEDVIQIGDPKADDWTNIGEVIHQTEGKWKPAIQNGKPVDCVYFNRTFLNGSRY